MGRGTGLGMVKESTYGTAVSRTDWMELISESLARDVQRPFRPHLVGGSTGLVQQDVYAAGDDAGGDLEFEAVYNAICFGHVIFAAMGAVSTSGPSGSEYTHQATFANTLPSWTMEVLKGNGTAEVFEGMKCTKLTLSLSPRDVMRVRTSWIGETSGGRVSQGTPSYTSSAAPILHSQAPSTGVTWNSVNFAKVTSFELTIDNKLETRPYLGSAFTSEPDFSGFREVTFKVSMHWDSDSMWSGLTAGTSSDAVFNIAGTGDNDLNISLENALVTSVSDPISSAGVVVQTVTLQGRSVAAAPAQGLALTLKNSIAAASYDW
tara:strand:- start:1687 stop:2646 length:960 start_codon:yes stop_codon:yes gene_type:complete